MGFVRRNMLQCSPGKRELPVGIFVLGDSRMAKNQKIPLWGFDHTHLDRPLFIVDRLVFVLD